MKNKIRRLGIGAVLAVVIALTIVVVSYSEVGVTSVIGTEGLPLPAYDLSAIPQVVVEDAIELSTELFGDCKEKCDDFVNQLLAIYSEAKGKDFVMVFNPGGWGRSLVEASPCWLSIFIGIESELNSSGYTLLLLNYQRTVNTLGGYLDEIGEMITGYPSKVEDLAYRMEFLVTHIPDLRVIITGESNGTLICDRAMDILTDNPQVYSIQTGPPFWHNNIMLDRTLVLTYNGRTPDSFSQGEFLTLIRANLRALFGLPQPESESGVVGNFVRAPGHDYWWQYHEVRSEITGFLQQNFGVKW